MLDLNTIMSWLIHYGYFILFPIVVIEGPIITVIAGLFLSLGYLNGPLTFIIIIIADTVGDVLHYSIGRISRIGFGQKIINIMGFTEARLKAIENHFVTHPKKTLILGKLAHGVGGGVLIAAGMAKMNLNKFISFNVAATIPKSLILLLIGYFFGQYILKIKNILDYGAIFALSAAFVLVISYLLINRYARKSESALNGK